MSINYVTVFVYNVKKTEKICLFNDFNTYLNQDFATLV